MTPIEAANIIMSATKPLTRLEVESLMGQVYNTGYDAGRDRGYEMAQTDQALEDDYHFNQGYDAGRAEGR